MEASGDFMGAAWWRRGWALRIGEDTSTSVATSHGSGIAAATTCAGTLGMMEIGTAMAGIIVASTATAMIGTGRPGSAAITGHRAGARGEPMAAGTARRPSAPRTARMGSDNGEPMAHGRSLRAFAPGSGTRTESGNGALKAASAPLPNFVLHRSTPGANFGTKGALASIGF